MKLREVLGELLATGPGRAGAALLLALVALSVYVVVRFPFDFGETRWSNPARWADNPKAAPPSWSSVFSGKHRFRHSRATLRQPSEVDGARRLYRMAFSLDGDEPPTFASVSLSQVAYRSRPPVFTVSARRPDGAQVVLYRLVAPGPRPGEEPPFLRYRDESLRIALTTESTVADALRDFFRDRYGADLSRESLSNSSRALVSVPDPAARDGLRLLRGRYELQVQAAVADEEDSIGSVRFVVGGSLFGLMGTDSLGRDLASGLAFGLPIALLIGVATSLVTTVVGTSLGVMSGYLGGAADMAIQRLADIVSNVPLLPLLIFLVFIFGPHLFLIMLFLVAFSWPGLTILIRSMVLQLRSGQLIEAAVAIGASKWRVMARHIFPQTAPFVFAQLIFFAPAAILAEAGLSILGLGDPSIPTWGQILEQGFRTGAVYVGYWWWVVPPGVLIVITAVTFMLLSLGMEPVVNPRLRRSR